MSTTYVDAETTNTLIDTLGHAAPPALSRDEHDRILSDIASLRAGIADLDTAIACESGAFRSWCLDVRQGMRRDVALLWQQLGEEA